MERNEYRMDALDPKFDGPLRVLDVRNADVKIPRKNKPRWIHANGARSTKIAGSS